MLKGIIINCIKILRVYIYKNYYPRTRKYKLVYHALAKKNVRLIQIKTRR